MEMDDDMDEEIEEMEEDESEIDDAVEMLENGEYKAFRFDLCTKCHENIYKILILKIVESNTIFRKLNFYSLEQQLSTVACVLCFERWTKHTAMLKTIYGNDNNREDHCCTHRS